MTTFLAAVIIMCFDNFSGAITVTERVVYGAILLLLITIISFRVITSWEIVNRKSFQRVTMAMLRNLKVFIGNLRRQAFEQRSRDPSRLLCRQDGEASNSNDNSETHSVRSNANRVAHVASVRISHATRARWTPKRLFRRMRISRNVVF